MKEPATVSISIEIPEALYDSVTDYIANHRDWNPDRVGQSALSLFLMQNGTNEPHVSRQYLDSLLGGGDE